MKHKSIWAIYSKDGIPITIKIKTNNGLENMKLFSNLEAAQCALDTMTDEDKEKYGARILEVKIA